MRNKIMSKDEELIQYWEEIKPLLNTLQKEEADNLLYYIFQTQCRLVKEKHFYFSVNQVL